MRTAGYKIHNLDSGTLILLFFFATFIIIRSPSFPEKPNSATSVPTIRPMNNRPCF